MVGGGSLDDDLDVIDDLDQALAAAEVWALRLTGRHGGDPRSQAVVRHLGRAREDLRGMRDEY